MFTMLERLLESKLLHRLKTIKNSRRCVSENNLSRRKFWKERYLKDSSAFDWLTDSTVTVQSVLPYLEEIKDDDCLNMLDLGCGTSMFPCKLLEHLEPRTRLICFDYVPEALHFQKQKSLIGPVHQDKKFSAKMLFVCGDGEYLPFKSSTMSIVFDKGTTDSLLKDKINGIRRTSAILYEVFRVLVPNGRLLQFTDEDPDIRIPFLEESLAKHNISINFKTLTYKDLEYFMYCIKKENLVK